MSQNSYEKPDYWSKKAFSEGYPARSVYKLAEIDDAKAAPMISLNLQKPTLMLIIAILLGWERFFLDDIGLGVVKVITCYGCGIWWLIDIFSAQKRTYAYNYKKFCEAYMLCK